MSRGALYALGCYVLWGIVPIYWKLLSDLPGLETTSHRVLWSTIFATILLTWQRNRQWIRQVIRQPRVLLGVMFLGERPRTWQWAAIGIATIGVLYLTLDFGRLPWIALGLASSFAFYALLKKKTTLPSLQGLFLETSFLAIPLTIYLFNLEQNGQGAFGNGDWKTSFLLILAGVVTALPLFLFSEAARTVPLTLLGILQYISPTIQFVIGIVLFHEPFSASQLVGFSFIWVALIVFTLEGTAEHRRLQLAHVAAN